MSKRISKPNYNLKVFEQVIPVHLKPATTEQEGIGGGVLTCDIDHSQFKQLYRDSEGHEKTIGQIDLRNLEGIIYSAKEKRAFLDAHTPQEIVVEEQKSMSTEIFFSKYLEYISTEKYEVYDNGINEETINQLRTALSGKVYKATFGYRGQERPAILTATASRILVVPLLDWRQIKDINQGGLVDATGELKDFAEKKRIDLEEQYYTLKREGTPIEVKTKEQVVEGRRVKLDITKFK